MRYRTFEKDCFWNFLILAELEASEQQFLGLFEAFRATSDVFGRSNPSKSFEVETIHIYLFPHLIPNNLGTRNMESFYNFVELDVLKLWIFANSGAHPSISFVLGRPHAYNSIAFHAMDIHRILYLLPGTLSHKDSRNSKRFQKYLIFWCWDIGKKFFLRYSWHY